MGMGTTLAPHVIGKGNGENGPLLTTLHALLGAEASQEKCGRKKDLSPFQARQLLCYTIRTVTQSRLSVA